MTLFKAGLQEGMLGEEVKNLNNFLHIYFDGLVNPEIPLPPSKDIFDKETAEKLKLFQKRHRLKESGILDNDSLLKINNVTCITMPGYILGKRSNAGSVAFVTNRQRDRRLEYFNKTQISYFFKNITLIHRYENGNIFQLNEEQSYKVLQQSMNHAFNQIIPLGFKLDEAQSENADITIEFAPQLLVPSENGGFTDIFGENSLIWGSTFGPLIKEYPKYYNRSEIYINERKKWSDHPTLIANNYPDIVYVLLHEICHALGLSHSDQQQAIMWESYINWGGLPSLFEDDKNGLKVVFHEVTH